MGPVAEATTKAPRLLQRGATGDDVRRLQDLLGRAGFPVDISAGGAGSFGPRTEKAVRDFQSARGLDVDGKVGGRTWAALFGGGPTPQSLSDQGARFVARFEGFESKPYDDPAGHCTIGYGHLIHRGRCNGSEPVELRAGISEARALEILRADAAVAAEAVRTSVKVPLTQEQFDALVSFTFNLGAGNLRSSTLLKKLNAGDYGAVPAELSRWNKAGGQVLGGLVKRREAEGLLFRHGRY
jgi:lysozyme